jgi:NADH-quinone oxidoreductase subunit L
VNLLSHSVLAAGLPMAEEGAHAPVVAPDMGAGGVFDLLWLVIALPVLGAVLLLGVAPFLPASLKATADKHGHLLGTAMAALSFVLSLVLFFALLGRDAESRQVGQQLWTWFETGSLTVGMDLLYDQLAALFLLLITGVGSLIHVYAIGYMEHDPRRRRFFGYLNLFVAAMLTLILSANYVGLFLGWEGVGLASYLLIGFWQHKPSAAAAAKKAFVINRVGDIGLSLAIALMFATFGTTDFGAVSELAGEASQGTLNALGLLLLLGACGKSAQVPLQSWLLDAMEGPTPVSALIHAATMVTAGVYLVVRSNFIYDLTPVAQTAVVVVATVTLLWGAVLGCAKDDIKKALAGSTMSQIGYMMLAAGLGPVGYPFAIFHLLTHGFFKANMFLGAGSVMHGMNDDVDMRHYGALNKAMPVTFLTFAMGYLAIIGFPGFSGFWSKDRIIETALAENLVIGILALIGAGITGFYMTRLMLMTFFGEKRWEKDVHPHESPKVMTVPLIVLAALSVLGGALLLGDWIVTWLEPVTGHVEHHEPPLPAIVITLIITAVVALGVAAAWFLVGKREIPREAPQDVSFATRAARADLYGDAINDAVVVRPGAALVGGLATFDRVGVDGVVEGGSSAVGGLSTTMRRVQNGFVRSYALSLLGGALLVVLALLAVNLG